MSPIPPSAEMIEVLAACDSERIKADAPAEPGGPGGPAAGICAVPLVEMYPELSNTPLPDMETAAEALPGAAEGLVMAAMTASVLGKLVRLLVEPAAYASRTHNCNTSWCKPKRLKKSAAVRWGSPNKNSPYLPTVTY